ncbi:hypothetical protein EBU99_10655 [bacterium]|nr:hypothetical protein [bacterium]
MRKETSFLIVGAGAAGCAAAKCFAAARLAPEVVLLEQHSEPGGSAGYFSRGGPRRTFDAGATQLIECQSGQLQELLYSMCPAKDQKASWELFEPIPQISQHWNEQNCAVILRSDGRVIWSSQRSATEEEEKDLRRLEKFLAMSGKEADWMWQLLKEIPRFPPQSWADIKRALELFGKVPWIKKISFPVLFFLNAEKMLRLYGIRPNSLAYDVVAGLLVDTTQSSPQKSPWLAAAMGISIIRRGLFRCRKGMRGYFRPLLSSFEQNGGVYTPHSQVIRLETHPDGFLVTSRDSRSGELAEHLVRSAALLNLTIWDIASGLIPPEDPLNKNKVFKTWSARAAQNKGWGAFALYALVEDKPEWDDVPQYLQLFPSSTDPQALQTPLYVSIPARSDQANPSGFRVLTATLHVAAEDVSEQERSTWKQVLMARISAALNARLESVETATPATFARYTARKNGQVGGIPLALKNFMFFAPPSQLTHPTNKKCKLLLIGDTVFPGQGVVACSVSGIAAFERATNLTFQSIQGKTFGLANGQ